MHRDSDATKDPIAHVILNVTDMAATVAAIKAAGGTMDGDPVRSGTPASSSASPSIPLATA